MMNLTLSEKLLLLSIHPDKGGYYFSTSGARDYALLGALLIEMELAGYLKFEGNRITGQPARTHSPTYDYLLGKILASGKSRKMGYWLNTPGISKSRIRKSVLQSLITKKEVRMQVKHFLFFSWKVPGLQSGYSATRLAGDLRRIVHRIPDESEDILLLTLLEPAQLLRRIFPDRKQHKIVREKIKSLQTGSQVPEAVRNAIRSAAAVTVAVSAGVAAAARGR